MYLQLPEAINFLWCVNSLWGCLIHFKLMSPSTNREQCTLRWIFTPCFQAIPSAQAYHFKCLNIPPPPFPSLQLGSNYLTLTVSHIFCATLCKLLAIYDVYTVKYLKLGTFFMAVLVNQIKDVLCNFSKPPPLQVWYLWILGFSTWIENKLLSVLNVFI